MFKRTLVLGLFFVLSIPQVFSLCLDEDQISASFYCDELGCTRGLSWEHVTVDCCKQLIKEAQPVTESELQLVTQELENQGPITPGIYERQMITGQDSQLLHRQGNADTLDTELEQHMQIYADHVQTEQRNQLINKVVKRVTHNLVGGILILLLIGLLFLRHKLPIPLALKVVIFMLPLFWLLLKLGYYYLGVEIMC